MHIVGEYLHIDPWHGIWKAGMIRQPWHLSLYYHCFQGCWQGKKRENSALKRRGRSSWLIAESDVQIQRWVLLISSVVGYKIMCMYHNVPLISILKATHSIIHTSDFRVNTVFLTEHKIVVFYGWIIMWHWIENDSMKVSSNSDIPKGSA